MGEVRKHVFRSNKASIFFISLLVLYPFSQLLSQPNWLINGGMWAEAATNYFPISKSNNWFVKLFSTDAGYIPLPQRLISAATNDLLVPAEVVPYVYNWIALILSALMVAVFCLTEFRKLIRNDVHRLIISILVLCFSEWEVRTYINFTYFGVFFVFIISSVLLTYRREAFPLPWYFWLAPVVVLSKPAVLATLPIFVILLFRRTSSQKIKVLSLVTLVTGFIQLIQILISRSQGVFDRGVNFDFISQLDDLLIYFFGIPGTVFSGIRQDSSLVLAITSGIILFLISILLMIRSRQQNELLITSWSLLLFSILLNLVTLPYQWNISNWPPNALPVTNHSIAPYMASIVIFSLIMLKCIDFLSKKIGNKFAPFLASIFLMSWLISSGWLMLNLKNSLEPNWPRIGNSNWVESSYAIDQNFTNLCVTADPIGWVYGNNCKALNTPNWYSPERFQVTPNSEISLQIPTGLNGTELSAISLGASPTSSRQINVSLLLEIKLIDGSNIQFTGSKILQPSGGGIELSGTTTVPINQIAEMTLRSNYPFELIGDIEEDKFVPSIIWMGH